MHHDHFQKHIKSTAFIQHRTVLHSENAFKTINSEILNQQDKQKKALQYLLDLQFDSSIQAKNPQTDFMALTKNVRINSFETVNLPFGFVNQENFVSRNKFRKSKSSFNNKNNKQKDAKKVEAGKESDKPLIYHMKDKKRFYAQRLQNFFARTKSNLLTPRQSLPTIHASQSHYSVLGRKPKSILKSYSSGKSHNQIRLSSVIKFRQQLSLLPTIQKQIKRRRLNGYD